MKDLLNEREIRARRVGLTPLVESLNHFWCHFLLVISNLSTHKIDSKKNRKTNFII